MSYAYVSGIGIFLFLAVLASPLAFEGGPDVSLTPEEKTIHVLSRLTFGPTQDNLKQIRSIGIEQFVEQQLHPERLPDARVRAMLVNYPSLALTLPELLERDVPPGPARELSLMGQLERTQRTAEGISGRPKVTNPIAAAASRMPSREPSAELIQAKLLRAVYSERQLYELMVDFWMNHFNVDLRRVGGAALVHFEESVVRPRALGSFEELLIETARHPAMLIYLDNGVSSTSSEEVARRLRIRLGDPALTPGQRRESRVRMPERLETFKGLNENFARELMELHTLGVDGGYTQEDVIQVARALTGWTVVPSGPREEGIFGFDPDLHEKGDKMVLGRAIPSGGVDEGLTIIRMLSRHPSTARFVSTKLVRRFVSDDPPPETVDAAATTFTETNGDIRAVLKTIFTSPEFFTRSAQQGKVKKPLELVVSTLRAFNAEIPVTPIDNPDNVSPVFQFLNRSLSQMGEPLYRCEPPTGYPDLADAWINTNALMRRLNFSFAVTSGQVAGLEIELEAGQVLLDGLGLPRPDSSQIERGRQLASDANSQTGDGAPQMGMTMRGRGDGGRSGYDPQTLSTGAIVAALRLGSPAFQKR